MQLRHRMMQDMKLAGYAERAINIVNRLWSQANGVRHGSLSRAVLCSELGSNLGPRPGRGWIRAVCLESTIELNLLCGGQRHPVGSGHDLRPEPTHVGQLVVGRQLVEPGRRHLQGLGHIRSVPAALRISKVAWAERCESEGLCTFTRKGVRCSATAEDCEASSGCRRKGRCGIFHGKCDVTQNDDCAEAEACKKHGQCSAVARNGAGLAKLTCQAADNDDCKNSEDCTERGPCTAAGGCCR